MSYYRKIDVRLWTDNKVIALSIEAKLLWIYILTGQHTLSGPPGLYRVGELTLSEGLGLSLPEPFTKAFKELRLNGLIEVDKTYKVLSIPNALKYNKPINGNVLTNWLKLLDAIPDCSLKLQYIQGLKLFGEQFSISLPEPFEVHQSKDQSQSQSQSQSKDQSFDEKNNDLGSKKEARKKKKLEPLYPDHFEEVGKLWRAAHGSPNFNRKATVKWWNHWVGWANGLCNGIQEIDGMRAHHVEKQMLKATKLYLARCLANKITVKNSSTFFGPEGHWKDELDREDQVKEKQAARRQQQQPADAAIGNSC